MYSDGNYLTLPPARAYVVQAVLFSTASTFLNAAPSLATLRNLRSNRFEALKGARAGQYSIRINQQWRICFIWPSGSPGPRGVEIVDYHK